MANELIGKNFTPPDIHGKVTGRARYAEDFRADGMLFCRLATPHSEVPDRSVGVLRGLFRSVAGVLVGLALEVPATLWVGF